MLHRTALGAVRFGDLGDAEPHGDAVRRPRRAGVVLVVVGRGALSGSAAAASAERAGGAHVMNLKNLRMRAILRIRRILTMRMTRSSLLVCALPCPLARHACRAAPP